MTTGPPRSDGIGESVATSVTLESGVLQASDGISGVALNIRVGMFGDIGRGDESGISTDDLTFCPL